MIAAGALLSVWSNERSGLAVRGHDYLEFHSGTACSPEGWASRFMLLRAGPPPTVRTSIAPSVVHPRDGRRNLFKPRALSAPIGALSRVGRLAGVDRSYGARNSLRRKAWQLRATEGGANARPSVCVVSRFRHAHNMTETTCPSLRNRTRAKPAEYETCPR
jgi:hypothetical protein